MTTTDWVIFEKYRTTGVYFNLQLSEVLLVCYIKAIRVASVIFYFFNEKSHSKRSTKEMPGPNCVLQLSFFWHQILLLFIIITFGLFQSVSQLCNH